MTFNPRSSIDEEVILKLNRLNLEYIEEFNYLGCLINKNFTDDNEIKK